MTDQNFNRHSPEPWSVVYVDWLAEDSRRVLDANGVSVLADCSCDTADAQRIVACVNACAGIPDQNGEITLIGDMVMAILNNNPAELAAVKGKIIEILA
jgi:hypothetical protein